MHFPLLIISLLGGALIFLATIRLFPARTETTAAAARVSDRFNVRSSCELFWHDAAGDALTARTFVVDISDEGAKLKATRAFDPQALVVLRLPEYKLGGSAWVRRCQKKGLFYEVGLQFNGPLTRSV